MTSTKHPRKFDDRKGGLGSDTPRPPDDLERNPGIGSSKGVFSRTGVDPEDLEAQSTSEGDVMSDATPEGGVDPNQQGRTNK